MRSSSGAEIEAMALPTRPDAPQERLPKDPKAIQTSSFLTFHHLGPERSPFSCFFSISLDKTGSRLHGSTLLSACHGAHVDREARVAHGPKGAEAIQVRAELVAGADGQRRGIEGRLPDAAALRRKHRSGRACGACGTRGAQMERRVHRALGTGHLKQVSR